MTIAATDRRPRTPRGAGDSLRTEILDAATELLGEAGSVAAVSLRAVARRVGIATTSIYLHFPDMEALVLAVKVQLFGRLVQALQASLDAAGPDAGARLRAAGMCYVRFGLDHPGQYRVMFSLPGPHGLPTGTDGLMVGSAAFGLIVAEIAAAVGVPVDDPQAKVLAVNHWAFVDGIVHLRTARPAFPWPPVEDQIAEHTARTLMVPRETQP